MSRPSHSEAVRYPDLRTKEMKCENKIKDFQIIAEMAKMVFYKMASFWGGIYAFVSKSVDND